MFKITKKNIVIGFVGILYTGIFVSCASLPIKNGVAPTWVTDTSAEFPDSEYLTAVGHAKDRNTAEAEAIANLSKIIKQRVEAQSTASQSFENNLTEQNRAYETTVTTSSLLDEIIGIKIQEIYVASDDTTYALALLDRRDVGSFYSQKIKENEDAINGLLNFMIDNEATFEGVKAAQNALSIAYDNETYLELLAIINPSMYRSIELAYKSANAIEVLIQLEKEKIYIGVIVNNDVDNRIASALSEVFKKAGYKTERGNNYVQPSTDMPYVLYGELSINPFAMSSSQSNKYVRFILNTELLDVKSKTFLPWNISGREAHLTEEEAAQRAIRTIEELIEKDFYKEVENLLR